MHPLLKLWNECKQNIESAKKSHLIRCIPVFTGVFIEELEVALNETAKKFQQRVSDLGGRELCPFSSVLPGEWVAWFIDYCICIKHSEKTRENRERIIRDNRSREDRGKLLTGNSAIQRLFKLRNTAAHFNKYSWEQEKNDLKKECILLGEFCENLITADLDFAEELSTSLITHEKSSIYCLNSITLARSFWNTLLYEKLQEESKISCIQSVLDWLVEKYDFECSEDIPLEEKFKTYFREFHNNYGNLQSNQSIYKQKIDEIIRIMETAFRHSFQEEELDDILDSFRQRIAILTRKENISQEDDVEMYLLRISSSEDKISPKSLNRLVLYEGSWKQESHYIKAKEYSPSDFVSELKLYLKKSTRLNPDDKKTILIMECETLSNDENSYDALTAWGKIKSNKSQTLYNQFRSIITMVADLGNFEEDRPKDFPEEFQIGQNIALVSCPNSSEQFWPDIRLHGGLLQKESNILETLISEYEINKHVVCLSASNTFSVLKEKLSTKMSINSIFDVCKEININNINSPDYVSCIVSYAEWDLKNLLEADMPIRS